MKRLEKGCFQRPVRSADGQHVVVSSAELQWILTGVELSSVKNRSRYVPLARDSLEAVTA
jgi:hypothetical protein